jgi:parvulin-like peptidyl-prolyl isomerase
MKPKPLEKGIAIAILIPLVIGCIGLLLNTHPETTPSKTPSLQTPPDEKSHGKTGETLPQATPLPEGAFSHPAWAPQNSFPQTEEDTPKSTKKVSFPKIVAKVNGKTIKGETLQKAFTEALQGEAILEENLSEDQKLAGAKALLQELVLDEILSQHIGNQTVSEIDIQAEFDKTKNYFANDTEFKDFLKTSKLTPAKLKKEIKETLAKRSWLDAQAQPPEISPEEAKRFYEENLKDFHTPEALKAQQILFVVNDNDSPEAIQNKKKAAQNAYERASQGEDFGALAKELSEGPKESSGEVGFFVRDLVLPEFAEAAFSQEVGQVGAPVLTPLGWHIIKVLEKIPAKTSPFEEVQPDIIEYLKEASRIQTQADALKNLENSAKVEIFLSEETLYTPKPSKTEDPESTKPAQTDAPKDAPKDPSKDPEAALKAVFDTKMEAARAASLAMHSKLIESLKVQPDEYKTAVAQNILKAFQPKMDNLFITQRAADWNTIQKKHAQEKGATNMDINAEISSIAREKVSELTQLTIDTAAKTLKTMTNDEQVEQYMTQEVFRAAM